MTTPVLLSAYAAAGLLFGYLVYRRAPRKNLETAASVAAAALLWPLWAPFALTQAAPARRGPLATRVAAALACEHAPSATVELVMEANAASRLLAEVERAEARLGEIEARLGSAKRAPTNGPADGATTHESRARAEIRTRTIEQLEHLRRREHQALLDLAEVCELLRAQSALARFGLSDRAEELRDELWARVQALSEVSGLTGRSGVDAVDDHRQH